MSRKRIITLLIVLAVLTVITAGGWWAGSNIQSPAEAAARTAPPTPSPILVPVEQRVLSTRVVTRGTARFGLPRTISIVRSALKPQAGVITSLPIRNTQLKEGDVALTTSGRPVFVLQGDVPAHRDLVPGISGDDVRQLELALQRMGFDPGPMDGDFDQQTSAAVAAWYASAGWQPFGTTLKQLAKIRVLQQELAVATNKKLAADDGSVSADRAVAAARAAADQANRVAAIEFTSKSGLVVKSQGDKPLPVRIARAAADHAKKAAEAKIVASILARKKARLIPRIQQISLNPQAGQGDLALANAELELARAAVKSARLEGEMAIQAAIDSQQLARQQLELARTGIESTRLAGEIVIQAAVDAKRAAEREAKMADATAVRIAADLDIAQSMAGVQVPVDETVFIPKLPVRVEQIDVVVGNAVRGPVIKVTDNQLAIDSSLRLDEAPLVKPGMVVSIDEQALGIKATGVVKRVANTPGTYGVDGYHIYFEVTVDETHLALEGFSLRLTIPIESTGGAVAVVPVSALSLAADGKSRVQVDNDGELKFVVVDPGLSADGFVEVTPIGATLTPGQLVVVGYENGE